MCKTAETAKNLLNSYEEGIESLVVDVVSIFTDLFVVYLINLKIKRLSLARAPLFFKIFLSLWLIYLSKGQFLCKLVFLTIN